MPTSDTPAAKLNSLWTTRTHPGDRDSWNSNKLQGAKDHQCRRHRIRSMMRPHQHKFQLLNMSQQSLQHDRGGGPGPATRAAIAAATWSRSRSTQRRRPQAQRGLQALCNKKGKSDKKHITHRRGGQHGRGLNRLARWSHSTQAKREQLSLRAWGSTTPTSNNDGTTQRERQRGPTQSSTSKTAQQLRRRMAE